MHIAHKVRRQSMWQGVTGVVISFEALNWRQNLPIALKVENAMEAGWKTLGTRMHGDPHT